MPQLLSTAPRRDVVAVGCPGCYSPRLSGCSIPTPCHHTEGYPAGPADSGWLWRGKDIWDTLARRAKVAWKDKSYPWKARKKKNQLLKLSKANGGAWTGHAWEHLQQVFAWAEPELSAPAPGSRHRKLFCTETRCPLFSDWRLLVFLRANISQLVSTSYLTFTLRK